MAKTPKKVVAPAVTAEPTAQDTAAQLGAPAGTADAWIPLQPVAAQLPDGGLLSGSVRIAAKREGFRRAGMAHSVEPVVHPPGVFDEGQIAALLAEPNLIVELA